MNPFSKYLSEHKWQLLLCAAVLVNFSALFNTILGTDGTLYACVAKTMAKNNDLVNLYNEGKDWLDKPHFPFWITAFSFKLFGFTNWAYKLPAVLFMMMGVYYTYLLAKTLYNKQVAIWAALILLTAEHIVISNSDVRAEPYLTGLTIAAIYYFYKAYTAKKFYHLLAACLFTACAMMTKGLFAVIPIGGAIAGELIIKKNWKELFNLRWLLAALLILIFIIPELYCLYVQFDLHPEKTVWGMQHVSGIKFFFWDSQFGRFMNTGPIKGQGDIFFFFHTLLWAFLPWSLLLYAASFYIFRKRTKTAKEYSWICVSGSLLTFVIFSVSKFQLPYYLNFIFPLFAIIVAEYFFSILSNKTIRVVNITQKVIAVLILLISGILIYFFKPSFSAAQIIMLTVLLLALFRVLFFIKTTSKTNTIIMSLLASFFVNLLLNIVIYPQILTYQSGSEAAFWINKYEPGLPVVRMDSELSYALEFYLKEPLHTIDTSFQNKPSLPFLLYANDNEVKKFMNEGHTIKILRTFKEFHISMLTGKFINKATRNAACQDYDVAECYK